VQSLHDAKELQEKLKQARLEIKNGLPNLAEKTLKNKEMMRFVTDSEAKFLQGVANSRGLAGSPLQVALRGQETMEIITRAMAAKQKLQGIEGMREQIKSVEAQIDLILSAEEHPRKQVLTDEVANLLWELVPGQLRNEEVAQLSPESLQRLGNGIIESLESEAKRTKEPIPEEMRAKMEILKSHLKEFSEIGARRKALQNKQTVELVRKARKDLGKELLEPVLTRGVAMQMKAKIMHKSQEQEKMRAHVITQEMLTRALLYASQHKGRGLKKTLNSLAKQVAPIPPRHMDVY
jgi:hypothetical protein